MSAAPVSSRVRCAVAQFAACVLLAACGGGGSPGAPGPSPAPSPGQGGGSPGDTPATAITAIANTTPQTLQVGTAMAGFAPLTPSGGTAPYTHGIASGTLPAGLVLDTATGTVTGTPTALYAAADVVFSVRDSTGAVAGTTSTVRFAVGMDFSVSTTVANAALAAPFMGRTKLMVGFSGDKDEQNRAVAELAPFDMQYQYFNSGAFGAGYRHADCLNGALAFADCKGWVTWQEDSRDRGLFAARFVQTAKSRRWNGATRAQIPFFTYYMVLPASGLAEGPAPTGETAALDDTGFLTNYFDDWRFLLQKIGNEPALLHVEPDLFGYLKARAAATAGPTQNLPAAIPAKVAASNPADCATGYTEDAAGYVRCMLHMVRKYAPNAKVGLHVSPWTHASAGDATDWAAFMTALGAGDGDFLVTDPSDRDADWYRLVQNQPGHDWDVARMNTFLAWTRAVSEAVGKPFVLWQLPLGNSYQDNTYQHYKDQRVELLFGHVGAVRDAHVVAMLFGSGEAAQTHAGSDGGLLAGKTRQHHLQRGGD